METTKAESEFWLGPSVNGVRALKLAGPQGGEADWLHGKLVDKLQAADPHAVAPAAWSRPVADCSAFLFTSCWRVRCAADGDLVPLPSRAKRDQRHAAWVRGTAEAMTARREGDHELADILDMEAEWACHTLGPRRRGRETSWLM